MTDYAVTARFVAARWGVHLRKAQRWLNRMACDGRAEEIVPRNPALPIYYRLTDAPIPTPPKPGREIKLAGCRIIIDISKSGKATARLIAKASRRAG